jgi:diaminopimelate decarboxylase
VARPGTPSPDSSVAAGLHCHVGTFVLEPDAYRQASGKLAAFASVLREEQGVVLEFIDMGGGFASPNTLKAQYLPGEQVCPSFSRYAAAIADGLSGLRYPMREMPTLVLETGRALVDEAGYLITSVVANKRLPDGTRALVLDGGVNLLFTSNWYKHDVLPVREHAGISEPTVMYGPLCMNIDVVREAVMFPPVRPGDAVVFRNVGAYNVTQWMQFITYRPAVVMVGERRQHGLLRKREDLETFSSHERTPAWLDADKVHAR